MSDGSSPTNSSIPLSQQLFWLALPVLGEQLLILGVGQFDTFLAGQIDKTATAAVGVAAYVGWAATLMFSLVGTGTSALVARAWGGGDRASGNRIFNQAVPLAMITGLLALGLIWNGAPILATVQNQSGEAHEICVNYLRMDALSHPFSAVMLVGSAALRGAGQMRIPLLIMLIVNIANALVSSCLVFGWGLESWGVSGIVGGTVFARVLGGILMLALLIRGHQGLQIQIRNLVFHWESVSRILNIGVPALVDSGCTWIGHFTFLAIVSHLAQGDLGEAIFAAHFIGLEVEALTYLPAVAWGTAAATLVGQSLGAGNIKDARRIAHLAVLQCGVLTACAAGFYFFGAHLVYQVMSRDILVREIGVPALRFLSFFQIPLTMLIIYIFALRGAGDTRTPMLITIGCTLCIRVPVAYLCGIVLEGGLIGAWTGMVVDNCVRASISTYRYTSGKWIHIKV
ncbi:MAG: mdtK 2 [Planctomycetaceae bacterium]|nr:mdtK 2 [Planctomycetaceae bacterium]